MRRWALLAVMLSLVVSACGGSDGDTADETTSPEQTTQPEETSIAPIVPDPGTYWGDFESQPGLTGRVKIEVAAGGAEITTLDLFYEMNDYECAGATHNVELGMSGPLDIHVPITDGAFSYGGNTEWEGTFVSETRAEGTLAGALMLSSGGPGGGMANCEIGPLDWSAELGADSG